MYRLSREARAIELLLGVDIAELLSSSTGSGEFDLLPIPDFLAWLPFIGGIALDRLESTISDILQIIRVMKSIYVLDPIREKIRDGRVNLEAIPQSGKKLRLVSVCLEDGEIYYVTEQGRLFGGHAANPRFNEPLGGDLATNLTDGAMASAGIPVVFPPVVLSGSGFSRTCVDGGVREILPMQAAVELGAHRIIGISASPNRLERFNVLSDNPELDFSDNNLLDIGQRGLDLATFEIKRNEISPPQGHCDQIERIFIVPTFSVQETTTIDPGLILINMAYGYMRAFETYRWFSQGLSNGALWAMVDNTDNIIQTRRRIWELENIAVTKVDPPFGLPDNLPGIEYLVFDPTTMAEIRRLKRAVFAAVQRRFETWGAESLPNEFSDPTTGYLNTAFDWWENWERHLQPTENRLRAHNPWRPLPIALTGPRARIEPSIPPKPVTPPVMRAALTTA
jgi:hypothetical protein